MPDYGDNPIPSYVDLNTIHNPSSGAAAPATWGDQARDNDEYLYQRGPYICTAATRPGAPFEGQFIYETDTDRYLHYSGAAWVIIVEVNALSTWVPTLTQSGAVTKTTTRATYTRSGKLISGWFSLTVTGSGTGANAVTVSTPVTAGGGIGPADVVGEGFVYDSSAATKYRGLIVMNSSTTMKFLTLHSTSDSYLGLVDFAAALAANDLIVGHFQIEAATAS